MSKLHLESKDLTSNNIELISNIFPHCITEQGGKKVIDFEKLKNEFNDDLADDTKEKYELTWPGKRKAINEAKIKTNKTLIPVKEKSVDFENTNNIYIEGDNLEVLKILQESYLNKVKCIYIDPPYNTGKDFIYKDDFKQGVEGELFKSGQIDEEGNKFIINTETNGRYHSDWLSMMYSRLKLSRNLLKEEGVIFISIDDNEVDNLKKLCCEIFGENNFIAQIVWERSFSPVNLKKHFSENHDFILCFAKNLSSLESNGLKRTKEADSRYKNPDNDERGVWTSSDFSVGPAIENNIYKIVSPSGRECLPPTGRSWRVSKKIFKQMLDENRVWFGEDGNNTPRQKRFLCDVKNSVTPMTIWKYSEVGHTQDAAKQLKELFDGMHVFDYTKTVQLIERIVSLYSDDSDVVLDFFSGSSTTAHAVMNLNAKDNVNRKYIMVQLPESISEKNSKSAYDFCIENDLEPIIPSIAQERIKRAGAKIKEETGADIDYGFKVFKLSDSILKENEVLPGDLQQDLLSESDSKYIDGISKLDIVTSIILDLGLMLDSKIVELENDNFIVEEDLLFISLSEEYDSSILDIIERILPDQVVLDEKTFNGSNSLMVNVVQQIKEINSDITINIL